MANEIAAIHYDPIESVDLSKHSESTLPGAWKSLAPSQSGSLRKFAWEICGGDVIYVAESYPSRLVGVGRVRGVPDSPAYQYRVDTPIVDEDGKHWRHIVPVDWEQRFEAISYPNPHAAQTALLDLLPAEITKIKSLLKGRKLPSGDRTSRGISSDVENEDDREREIQRRLVEASGYSRYSKEAIRIIERKHAKLCNDFTAWLERNKRIVCEVERRNIDVTFRLNREKVLVEFKIAYNSDPKPAIREALGQIIEYNFYPDRHLFDHWVLILNCAPTENDRIFMERVRGLGLPLSYGWQDASDFYFSAECPLQRL